TATSPHPETTSPQTPPYIPPLPAQRRTHIPRSLSHTVSPSTSPRENPCLAPAPSPPTPCAPPDPPSPEPSAPPASTRTTTSSPASVSLQPHIDVQHSRYQSHAPHPATHVPGSARTAHASGPAAPTNTASTHRA